MAKTALACDRHKQTLRIGVIETVTDLALKGNIPGRKIESDWRFLKIAIPQGGRYAIDEWLRSKSSSSILLSQAGIFVDDDSLAQLRESIYTVRNRPETDDILEI